MTLEGNLVEPINNFFENLMVWLGNWLLTFLPFWAMRLVIDLVSVVALVGFAIVVVLFLTWMERKVLARIADRIGPNRQGPFGLIQPVADALKMLIKEDITPATADYWLFNMAPIIIMIPALLLFAVIPFGPGMYATDLNVGILYMIALGSITGLSMLMAGWGSDNKYALLGAFRSVAQLVSYEVPMILVIVSVVMITGSLSMVTIVANQSIPFALLMPVAFVVYFLCAAAEGGRSPFDLMEGESEIVAGYFIEYSGMKFAMFYLAEYINLFVISAICTTLFLGGWKGPILPPYIWFLIKCFAVIFTLMWFRGTWPRFRIDQMLDLAWKVFVPLSLVNILLVGVVTKLTTSQWTWLLILLPTNIVIALVTLVLLGKAQNARLAEARQLAAQAWSQSS
jgi:NADH-quinone oxidoreductase subunit H